VGEVGNGDMKGCCEVSERGCNMYGRDARGNLSTRLLYTCERQHICICVTRHRD
jgi:hypothetical protein